MYKSKFFNVGKVVVTKGINEAIVCFPSER